MNLGQMGEFWNQGLEGQGKIFSECTTLKGKHPFKGVPLESIPSTLAFLFDEFLELNDISEDYKKALENGLEEMERIRKEYEQAVKEAKDNPEPDDQPEPGSA